MMRFITVLCFVTAFMDGALAHTTFSKTAWDWIRDDNLNIGNWFKDSMKKNRQRDEHWKAYKNKYKRHFKSLSSESRHRDAWLDNDKLITQHNKMADDGVYSYYTAQNQFSDMNDAELEKFFLKTGRPVVEVTGPKVTTSPYQSTESTEPYTEQIFNDTADITTVSGNDTTYENITGELRATAFFKRPEPVGLPPIVDWREEGMVTRVRNQLKCNSCSAFAALGALEAQWAKKTGSLINLSAQQIVDCGGPDAGGCIDGAWMDDIYKYILETGGVDSEVSYPYVGVVRDCNYIPECTAANLTSWEGVPKGNESALQEIVATVGPVAAAIATEKTFHFYSSGIYNNPRCSMEKKHALLIIGYGTEDGSDYWLVKNSWGKNWGTRGYGKVIRNNNNQCLISSYAYYPVV